MVVRVRQEWAEWGGRGAAEKENYPEREALRLRWALLAAAATALLLAAAAALARRLPDPLSRANGSEHRFIAEIAHEHLVNLTSIGPRVAGSYENEVLAVGVVVAAVKRIAATASPHNRVEFDVHTASGAFPLAFIDGMSHLYRDVQSVVVRVRGAGARPARSALLLNCHYDTVPDSPGASDDAAGCAVVLETLRALAAAPRALRHDVLALLNGAEENVLQASHAFVTRHRWARAARAFVNIEACGSGGREVLFQAGPGEPWLVEVYAAAAPHPFASSLAQELFQSGLIPADTDFRIFRDFGNLSGVDLAWSSNGYVYHTRLDTADRIPAAALQRTGDNVLALAHGLLGGEWLELAAERGASQPVFFDVMGLWVVSARAPAALAAAALTAALVLARLLLSARDAQRELSLDARAWRRAVWRAGAGAAAGAGAGACAAALAAGALHAAGARLAFYARPALLAPLYALPALAAAWGAGAALWARRRGAARLLRGAWAARAAGDALAALQAAALAAGAAAGLRSAFLPLLWALPGAAAALAAGALRAGARARLLAAAAAAALPAAQTGYLALASLDMFVPIMGRAGTSPLPPDVLMALTVAALAMTAFCWVQPLVIAARRPARLIYWMAAVSGATALLVAAGVPGAPYSAERPQRVMVFHTRRTVHARLAPPRHELLYWIPELDANTPRSLAGLVEGAAEARAGSAEECARFPYCGAPYYLPVLSLVARGHWLPAAAPPAPAAGLVAALHTSAHNATVQMLHVNVTGPHHIVMIVAPAAGARLGAPLGGPGGGGAGGAAGGWAGGATPQRGPLWRDAAGALRDTYFFAMHDARKPGPWVLQLPIEHTFTEAPAEWAALSLAGHSLSTRGPALERLLAALPAWTAPTGWSVDLHLYSV
ncbi:endoplasmic reticulum metallopeptidase 1-like isoform X2 [Epargyreus clarus]|uniref:endoplasmic reticulum metallopeptidase 1-like isoform X2 n=1 Tax=Epargyreus clarus TaxID=520877 RepID=UPI003C2EB596